MVSRKVTPINKKARIYHVGFFVLGELLCQINPPAFDELRLCVDLSERFVDAATVFDDAVGSFVTFVTGNEQAFEAKVFGNREKLLKHERGMSLTTMVGMNGVTDVAAPDFEITF